jgi:phosphoribosylamine--glycine ligase
MNILLLGSGAREHALAAAISQNPNCQLFIAPGNAGTAACGRNLPISMVEYGRNHLQYFQHIERRLQTAPIDCILPGSEQPLVAGISDYFRPLGIPVLGPSRAAAELEGSKAAAKAFMNRHNIPTARYQHFSGKDSWPAAADYIRTHPLPIVIKADGLASGKGVFICSTANEALEITEKLLCYHQLGQAGQTVVIEEFLTGTEVSVFVLCTGDQYILLPTAQDYKRLSDGNLGPNTGGMGSISPAPAANEAFMQKVEQKILLPTLKGLQAENRPYLGFLFLGLMAVESEPYVIEYNCRLGDPETQSILLRIKTDWLEIIHAVLNNTLSNLSLKISPQTALTVVCAGRNYPNTPEIGFPITGLEKAAANPNVRIFHAGTALNDQQQLITSGGRVLSVTAIEDTLPAARKTAYQALAHIHFEGMQFRTDIGLL